VTNQRDSTIVKMRNGGNTLQEIGDVFGISRERVRQILLAEKVAPMRGQSRRIRKRTHADIIRNAQAAAKAKAKRRIKALLHAKVVAKLAKYGLRLRGEVT
jgi:hypothetical protein